MKTTFSVISAVHKKVLRMEASCDSNGDFSSSPNMCLKTPKDSRFCGQNSESKAHGGVKSFPYQAWISVWTHAGSNPVPDANQCFHAAMKRYIQKHKEHRRDTEQPEDGCPNIRWYCGKYLFSLKCTHQHHLDLLNIFICFPSRYALRSTNSHVGM